MANSLKHFGLYHRQVNGNQIFSASDDSTVKIWDMRSPRCVTTLTGHKDRVRLVYDCVVHVVVGSFVCGLYIYTRCLQTSGPRHDTIAVSGSQDGQIRVWDERFPKKQSSLSVLRGHSDAITCLQLHWTMIVSGSQDKTIRSWHHYDCTKGAIKSVRPHQRGIVGLYMNEGHVVSGSLDGKIKLWRGVLS